MLVVLDVQTRMIPNQRDVARCLAALVHAAAEHNLVLLEHHPGTPRLLTTALRFHAEPLSQGFETIKSIPSVIEAGGGDCAMWAAWRLAENWLDEIAQYGRRFSRCKIYWRDHCLRCNQIAAPDDWFCRRCRLYLVGQTSREYHAEIRDKNGQVEDTSRLLGM